jgi:hypothetical protein
MSNLIQPPGAASLIKSGSAAAQATLDVTGLVGFRHYQIVLDRMVPATDADVLWMRTSADGGASYASAAASYLWAKNTVVATTPANTATGSNSDTEIELTSGVDSVLNNGASGVIWLIRPSLATRCPILYSMSAHDGAGVWYSANGAAERAAAAIVDAVRFMFSTGNIASGNYALYGYR